MIISAEKQTLLNTIVARLSEVPGVKAVVLGGSYARGTQHENSDLDVGIYYSEGEPFQIEDIRRVAASISAEGTPDVADFYQWGRWVNGGAWIHTLSGKVDFIYRNLDHVRHAIDDAKQGVTHHDFDQQPAFGFYSVIYLAETQVCLPLWDPQGAIARLKAEVAVYPPLLKEKAVASTLWMAEFSLLHAAAFAAAGNAYATIGTLTRVTSYLTQALFALNETYFMSDKTAMKEIAVFPILPTAYVEQLSNILAHPGLTSADLLASTLALHELWAGVVALTGGSYQPAFRL
jgi:predicted nucleotidyltransferase